MCCAVANESVTIYIYILNYIFYGHAYVSQLSKFHKTTCSLVQLSQNYVFNNFYHKTTHLLQVTTFYYKTIDLNRCITKLEVCVIFYCKTTCLMCQWITKGIDLKCKICIFCDPCVTKYVVIYNFLNLVFCNNIAQNL